MLLFPNKKMYVGYTTNLKVRFRNYKFRSKRPIYAVHYAIRKYGWDNVTKIILERSDDATIAYLQKREKFYIKQYNAFGKNGYNCTEGGEGTQGYRHSEMHKAAMSVKMKKKMESLSKSEKAKRIQFFKNMWKNMSEQEKALHQQKMKDGWGDRQKAAQSKRMKDHWKNMNEEQKSAHAQRRKDIWNAKWKTMNEEQKAENSKRMSSIAKKTPVRAISEKGDAFEFKTTKEAVEYLSKITGKKFEQSAISMCIHKKRKTHLGFRFESV